MFLRLCLLITVVAAIVMPSARQVKESATHLLGYSRGNDCISQAISNLKSSCQQLASTQKMLLALELTNCLLSQARKPIVQCSAEQDLDHCTSQLRGDGWTSFSNFYMHIDNLCYYYRSLIWEQKTSQLINGLTQSAAQTKEIMGQNLEFTKASIVQQKRLHEGLKQSIDSHKLLHIALGENTDKLANMSQGIAGSLSRIHTEIMTHYSSIRTVFETVDTALTQIAILKNIMVHEATHTTEVYYIVGAILMVLLGIMSPFQQARDRCLMLVLINWLLQKAVLALSLHRYFSCFWLKCVFLILIGVALYMSYVEYNKRTLSTLQDVLMVTNRISSNLNSARIKKLVTAVLDERDNHRKQIGVDY